MANSETYDGILLETRRALDGMNGLIGTINAEMTGIEKQAGWQSDVPVLARYTALAAEAKALARAMRRKSLETLPKLDQTRELQDLIKALRGAVRDLEKRRDRIRRLGIIGETFGDILGKVSTGAEKLDALRKKFTGEDTPPSA